MMTEFSINLTPVTDLYHETKDHDFWRTLPHQDYPHGVDVHFFEQDDDPGVFGVEVYPNYEASGFIDTDTSVLLMFKRLMPKRTDV